ncbi:MAG: VIT family protein [Phycicoccus sp.]|nr:VIT family protein [Phycicoccus sp.]
MSTPEGHDELHDASVGNRLNWLRAGVLGANDGVVSTSGLLVGVAAATSSFGVLLTTGLAGLSSGALSMAAGEYVSVSTQRDTEKALVAKERWELANEPELELEELAALYVAKGLSPEVAQEVAVQLTAHDALAAHAEVELKLDPEEYTNPWNAALASAVSFLVGGIIPFLTILLLPEAWKIPVTVLAAAIALALTGGVSARLGGAPVTRAIMRNVGGGIAAMAVTYAIGRLFGATVV